MTRTTSRNPHIEGEVTGAASNVVFRFSATSAAAHEEMAAILSETKAVVNTLAIALGDEDSDLAANPRSAGLLLWGVLRNLETVTGINRACTVAATVAEKASADLT